MKTDKNAYKGLNSGSRMGGWRSNFGAFGQLATGNGYLSSVQFNTGAAAATTQTPIVAGSNSAGTVGSGSSPTAGTGM